MCAHVCACLFYTRVISLLSPHSSVNKSEVLLVLCEDFGPAVSSPSSWSELYCVNVDLSWVDQFLPECVWPTWCVSLLPSR